MTMPHCALRTKDGDGPFCECGRFNIAGNGMPCATCQAEEAGDE